MATSVFTVKTWAEGNTTDPRVLVFSSLNKASAYVERSAESFSKSNEFGGPDESLPEGVWCWLEIDTKAVMKRKGLHKRYWQIENQRVL